MNNNFQTYNQIFVNYIREKNISKIVLTEEQRKRKLHNIYAYMGISREGLENCQHERLLLLYTTAAGEEVYIRYPGKESGEDYANCCCKDGKKKKRNPYDMRPELVIVKNGVQIANLSFVDLIDAFCDYNKTHSSDDMKRIAVHIMRIAFMEGFSWKTAVYYAKNITYVNGQRKTLPEVTAVHLQHYVMSDEERKELLELDGIYVPNKDYNGKVYISMEGLLLYFELLAQQEDCKYAFLAMDSQYKTLSIATGRINCCLTIVHAIYKLLNNESCNEIIAIAQDGVSPIHPEYISQTTGGVVELEEVFDGIELINVSELLQPVPVDECVDTDDININMIEEETTNEPVDTPTKHQNVSFIQKIIGKFRQFITSLFAKLKKK